jgi:hypothetical protein
MIRRFITTIASMVRPLSLAPAPVPANRDLIRARLERQIAGSPYRTN